MNTVREVLEYLLENDDPWKLDPKEKFLCNRCLDMQLAELIEPELRARTEEFIRSKIQQFCTLSEFHLSKGGSESVWDASWPKVRQVYLRQWIKELKETEDEQI